jgi:tetratricopeptide (TPR) repeat protein
VTGEHAAIARAQSLVAVKRWREAMEALAPAYGNEATAAEAHCLQAQCLLALGQPGQAADAARRALAAAPDSEWAHRLLAIAYLRMKHGSGAIAEAREAVRLTPKSAHALHVLALSQLLLEHRAAADQTARLSVAANPEEAVAHLTMAQVAVAHQAYALAERAYREALRLDPNNVDVLLGLGRVLRRLGRRDEAAEAYLAAGRADPADSRARHGLARIGLPVAGGGAVAAFAAKGVLILGAQNLIQLRPDWLRPDWTAVVVGSVVLVAGGITTALRVRGTRRLPEDLRRGLTADHRNAALRWLQVAAAAALVFAIWAAALPAAKGGGFGEAAGFAAFAITAAIVAHRFRTGPRRSAAEMARALGSRLSLRGRSLRPGR